jgi:hypothetical protein
MEHNKNFVGKNLQTRAIFLNFTAIYELKKISFSDMIRTTKQFRIFYAECRESKGGNKYESEKSDKPCTFRSYGSRNDNRNGNNCYGR